VHQGDRHGSKELRRTDPSPVLRNLPEVLSKFMGAASVTIIDPNAPGLLKRLKNKLAKRRS
jgi:hypothetical protein